MLARKLFVSLRSLRVMSRCPSSRPICDPKTRPPSGFWHNAFGKYLFFTNVWTSGVLMLVGDLAEQEIEYQRKLLSERYDWARMGRMLATGVLLGPWHHYFYGWMDRMLPHRTLGSVVQKIILDQFIMSPSCIAGVFYCKGMLEGTALKDTTKELKEKFWEVYTVDWCVWPPVQFLNFYLIPAKYQVLYINAVTMIYNVFISYIVHRNTVSEYIVHSNVEL